MIYKGAFKTVAVITGASGGIGKSIAKRLSRDGYKIIAAYHSNQASADETVSEIIAEGGYAVALKADVSKECDVIRLFDESSKHGNISLLVNSAGISHIGLFQDMTIDQINKIIGVDFLGTVLCCKEAAKMMVKQKRGVIINISSMWGEVGASCEVLYSACKSGIIGLTKALAKELGPSGVRINCISPGVINTAMNAELSAKTMSELKEDTPLLRIGEAEDIAEAVAFLASEKSSFITGQDLAVNGGFIT